MHVWNGQIKYQKAQENYFSHFWEGKSYIMQHLLITKITFMLKVYYSFFVLAVKSKTPVSDAQRVWNSLKLVLIMWLFEETCFEETLYIKM